MTTPFVHSTEFLLTVLGNGLWQSALIVAAAWLVLRIAKGANATTRHAMLVAALIGSVVLPIATTVAAGFRAATPPSPAQAWTSQAATPPVVHSNTSSRTAWAAPGTSSASHAAAARHDTWNAAPATGTQSASVSKPPLFRANLKLPSVVLYVLAAAWLVGVLLLLGRLFASLLYLERLKRDSLPLSVSDRASLERWQMAGKGSRDVRLCRSSEIETPIAVGIFDAMVLIPDRLLDGLAPDDLDRIILHELAHLRRGDDWLNAFERVAEALLFFNPFVRWIVRQLDLEREVACDDYVLERRAEALPYAQCLVKLVEETVWPYRPLVAPGVFVTRRSISIRIERLLAKGRDVRLRVAPAPFAAVASVVLAALALGLYVAPSVASSTGESQDVAAKQTAWKSDTRAPRTAPLHANRAAAVQPKEPAATQATTNPSTHSPASPIGETAKPSNAARDAEPPASEHGRPPAGTVARTGVAGHTAVVVHPDVAVHAAVATRVATAMRQSAAAATSATSTAASANPVPHAEPSVELIASATAGDYISSLEAVGYSNLSVDDLIKLKSVGVTADFIRGLRAAGYNHPSVNELVELRAIGISLDYIRDMRKLYPDISTRQLEEARAVGLTPDFVDEMRKAYPGATLRELTEFRAVGVTPSYIADLRAAGVHPLAISQLTQLRAVGVNAAYVRLLADRGFATTDARELTQLRAVGVNAKFLDKVKAHGFHDVTKEQLIRLRTSGLLD